METNGEEPLGNTSKPKASRINQLMKWVFTFNNYEEQDMDILETKFKQICSKFIFQEEVGENGTPHLQGAIWLKKAMRWSEFKLSSKIHWEKMIDEEGSINYCQKEDTRKINGRLVKWGFPKPLKIISVLRPWQMSLLSLIQEEPDDRAIIWIYNKAGMGGKTQFVKYCAHHFNMPFATAGSSKDIANLLINLKKNGKDLNDINCFLFNFARDISKISYSALESVKDGLMTNIKYEAESLIFNSPHIVVMSNNLPDFGKMSSDRWRVYEINDKFELVDHIKSDDIDKDICYDSE